MASSGMQELAIAVPAPDICGVVDLLWHCVEVAPLAETVLPTTGGMVVVILDRHLHALDVHVRRPGAAPTTIRGVEGRRSIGIHLAPGSWPVVEPVTHCLRSAAFASDPADALGQVRRFVAEVHERMPAERTPTLRRVEAALRTGTRVDDVCRAVAMDRRVLARAFTSRYGVGLKRFSVLCRFERAVAALREPDAPSIATVAADAGFADQAHLSRSCRDLCGLSAGRLHRRAGPSPAHVRHDETFKTPDHDSDQLEA
jgi:AraC-like DNA-binding protein